ncbi:MAG: hypothetical protein M9941_15445 [Anaerolineae bacterium]|nr:hypothetical protein [Anaerolineae bacterium]
MTGRQLARVNTVKYGETLWSRAVSGQSAYGQLSATCRDGDRKFIKLAQAQRQRTVWRFDGGAGAMNGSMALQPWVSRCYENIQLPRLCACSSCWRWDSYADCQLGEVSAPLITVALCAFSSNADSKRTNGGTASAFTSLQFPSKGLFMTAYSQRGGAEVEQFRQDKQGLALAARRKASLNGQKACVLLTDLAHNLLTHFSRHALAESRFRAFGLKRIVRDLLHIPGALHFEGVRVKKVELLTLNQNSRDLIICLEKYISGG